MKTMKKIGIIFFAMLVIYACKEKYIPTLRYGSNAFLVVEGYINSGAGPTTIRLTRTNKVIDTSRIVFEQGAIVRVLAQSGGSVQLTETSSGIYTAPQLTLNPATQYCLNIKTKDGREYQSDFSAVRNTPDIDSVSWKRKNGGVQTYVNTHDAQNKTKYYQWKYDETWEFHSPFISTLKIVYDSIGVPFIMKPRLIGATFKDSLHPGVADSAMLICWKNDSLTAINIGSSEKLAQDVISEQLTAFIPPNSQQLSVRYSINVKQYALSDKAYRFLQQMKRNTEQLGTIFDAQPSDNNGNVHCITDPTEPVIGFVEVSEEKQKRLFITRAQVPDWLYKADCDEVEEFNASDEVRAPSPLRAHLAAQLPTVVAQYGNGPFGITSIYFSSVFCVDCRLTGVNKKPAFW
jgi:hypothetical protein